MRVLRAMRGTMRPQVSIKSRLGNLGVGVSRNSIQARLGTRGGGVTTGRGNRRGGGAAAPILEKTPITDARQKINLNRVISGRIGDARQNIELKRTNRFRSEIPMGSQLAVSTMRSIGRGNRRGGTTRAGFSSPIKTLKITTSNSPGSSSGGLFRSAVSGMGESQWPYSSGLDSPPPGPSRRSANTTSSSLMLTRTIRNPQANYPPPPSGFMSSYSRMTAGGGGLYSSGPSTALTKITSITNRPRMQRLRASVKNPYIESDEEMDDDEGMDEDEPLPPPPPILRSSLKARLDVPSKFKVKVSNLQPSVTTDDITELFADVGDLISARVMDTGYAEAYYRTKSDCHKAIEAYHNRLLDGSPMKVIFVDDGHGVTASDARNPAKRASGLIATLKSAGGATMKIPKSAPNPNIKIHPDISAIHKVLFQPSSSSNSTKMLFNKTN